MNSEKFIELLQEPDSIQARDLEYLQQVIKDYPFFHKAYFLYLYGLHKGKPENFSEQLKNSAIYLDSRKELYKAIKFGISEVAVIIKENDAQESKVEQPIQTAEVLPVKEQIKEEAVAEMPAESLLPQSVPAEIPAESLLPEPVPQEITITDDEPAREVTFDDASSFSLEESQPIELNSHKDVENVPGASTSGELLEFELIDDPAEQEPTPDLIDQFLKENPRIVPRLDLEDTRGDISEPGLQETDEIVTETLAMILEQQGHYEKAKDAYQKLILKYPEKSTYFASRIEELSKRIK